MDKEFSRLRAEVWKANIDLPRAGLVTMHSGNASGLHRSSGLMLIKPSGVDYDTMKPEDLVVVRLADGKQIAAEDVPDGVQSSLRPSVDTIHHRLLYLNDARLGGVIHTHSNYATAWALHGQPLPCVLTAIADEFGGDIPCVPYVDNEEDHIATAMLAHRGESPAVLLAHHGVFAMDTTPRRAFKAAVMVEDVARTIAIARGLGPLTRLPDHEIAKWRHRYTTTYGQQ